MPGASLSRWTMSYFAAACLMLLVGQGLMVAGYGYPFADPGAPETLVVVHLVAIGWLSLLMAGALLQFVPMLIARPVVGARVAAPALLLLLGGLGCLVAGFVALSGALDLSLALLPVGGVMLLAGFGLFAGILATTLFSARPLPLPLALLPPVLPRLLAQPSSVALSLRRCPTSRKVRCSNGSSLTASNCMPPLASGAG